MGWIECPQEKEPLFKPKAENAPTENLLADSVPACGQRPIFTGAGRTLTKTELYVSDNPMELEIRTSSSHQNISDVAQGQIRIDYFSNSTPIVRPDKEYKVENGDAVVPYDIGNQTMITWKGADSKVHKVVADLDKGGDLLNYHIREIQPAQRVEK